MLALMRRLLNALTGHRRRADDLAIDDDILDAWLDPDEIDATGL